MFPAFDRDVRSFDTTSPSELAVLAVSILAFLFLLAAVLRLIFCGGVGNSLCRHCAGFLDQALAYLNSKDESSELRLLVEDKLRGQCLRHVVRFHQVACVLAFMTTIAAAQQRRGGSSPMPSLPAEQVLKACVLLVFGLSALFPVVVRERTVDSLCALPLLATGLIVLPQICSRERRVDTMARSTATVAFTILARRTVKTRHRVIFAGSYCFWVICMLANLQETGEAAEDHRILVGERLYPVAYVGFTAVLASLAMAFDVGLAKLMLANVEAQGKQQALAAATALLRSCCDVVAELDGYGCFVEHARDLSSFLLREGASLQGTRLADLIVDPQEREALTVQLAEGSPMDAGTAETMSVSLRDGNNSTLRMEVLWFKFERPDGRSSITAGLRDITEGAPAQRSYEQVPSNMLPTLDTATVPETSSVSSEGGLGTTTLVKAVLDATEAGLPLQAVTPAFALQMGRLPKGALLCDYLREPDAFVDWLKLALLAVRHGTRNPEDLEISMRVPRGRVTAKCCLEVELPHVLATPGAEQPQAPSPPQVADLTQVSVVFRIMSRKKRKATGKAKICPPEARGQQEPARVQLMLCRL